METLNKLKNLNFGVVTLILSLFLLVNTAIVFGTGAKEWERIILIYITMTAFLFALPDLRSKLFKINFWTALPRFSITILIGYVIAGTISVITTSNINFMSGISIGIVLTQAFIVAVAEESLFREFLGTNVGVMFAMFCFAIFHASAYGNPFTTGNFIKFIIAMIFALLMFFIRNRIGGKTDSAGTGLITIIGLHAGWNIAQYLN